MAFYVTKEDPSYDNVRIKKYFLFASKKLFTVKVKEYNFIPGIKKEIKESESGEIWETLIGNGWSRSRITIKDKGV